MQCVMVLVSSGTASPTSFVGMMSSRVGSMVGSPPWKPWNWKFKILKCLYVFIGYLKGSCNGTARTPLGSFKILLDKIKICKRGNLGCHHCPKHSFGR